MTRAQSLIYRALQEHFAVHEYSPSITEICRMTRKSRSTVHHHLAALQEQGRVKRSRLHGLEIVPRATNAGA